MNFKSHKIEILSGYAHFCNVIIFQIYRDRERERDRSVPNIHELTTRTVSMSRDQQIDHGFGICVKGGKDSGECING